MAANKTLLLEQYNFDDPAANVKVVDRPVPEPGEGEVLVRVTLRPVNPADVFSLQGVYPGFTPKSLPGVVGLDGVGHVEKNGPGASKFAPGTRVVAAPWPTKEGNGSWQQFVVVPEWSLIPVPSDLSDVVASQFLVNPVTVYGFFDVLETDGLVKTGWIINQAAGSALGRMVITLAKSKGIRTINLVRRRELEAELKALGGDEVLVTTEDDIESRIKEITEDKGADALFECVGGDISPITRGLRQGGVVFIYGSMAAFDFVTPIPDVLFRGITIRGFWLSVWLQGLSHEKLQASITEILKLLANGTLHADSEGHIYPLEKLTEALEEHNKQGRRLKVFLEG